LSSSFLLDPYIINIVAEPGDTYLDVGCGLGKWGYLIKISHKKPLYMIGGDPDVEAIAFLKEHRPYDSTLRFSGCHLPFREKIFDTSIVLEVIEHLQKSDGYKMLVEAERVAKKKVVVSTPLLGGRYWFRDDYHVSRWTPGDLRRKGYNVRGVGFSFFGYYSTPQLAFGLSALSYFIPWLSHILLGIKQLKTPH